MADALWIDVCRQPAVERHLAPGDEVVTSTASDINQCDLVGMGYMVAKQGLPLNGLDNAKRGGRRSSA